MNAIELKGVSYQWPNPNATRLDIPSLVLPAQTRCLIRGPSGAGKSTLLHLLCGLLSADSGHINVLGTDLVQLKEWQKDQFRADHIGLMFQQFNLLSYLTVEQNILLPLRFSQLRAQNESQPKAKVAHLMAALGLSETLKTQPISKLSIGQQQRVAAARALMGQPEIFVADEPTSALDPENRDRFIQQLFSAAEETATTIVIVSHDSALSSYFDQVLELHVQNDRRVTV